jgi:hypothetical protein
MLSPSFIQDAIHSLLLVLLNLLLQFHLSFLVLLIPSLNFLLGQYDVLLIPSSPIRQLQQWLNLQVLS